MIKINDRTKDELLALEAEGKINKMDYEKIVPVIDEMVKKYGKLKGYLEVHDLDTVTPQAFWEEIKADIKYLNNFDKIAVVGDATWKELLTKMVDLVPGLKTRYYEFHEKEMAFKWLNSK